MIEPTRRMVEEAARWHARLGDERNTAKERRDFEAWRAASPAHALAFDRLAGLSERIGGGTDIERRALKRMLTRRRRGAATGAAAILALALAGWAAWSQPAVQIALAEERTAPGAVREIALPDDSRLFLGTRSAVNLDMATDRRTVRLLAGEVMATVAKGRPVPFVVETEDGRATALGTAYSVRRTGEGTVVTVVESRVLACPRSGKGCLTLSAGERARLTGAAAERLPPVDPEQAAAWTRGWLAVDDLPLPEVLSELNRYRAEPVRFDPRALAHLRVSARLPVTDTERALTSLAAALPIRLERGAAGTAAIAPR